MRQAIAGRHFKKKKKKAKKGARKLPLMMAGNLGKADGVEAAGAMVIYTNFLVMGWEK